MRSRSHAPSPVPITNSALRYKLRRTFATTVRNMSQVRESGTERPAKTVSVLAAAGIGLRGGVLARHKGYERHKLAPRVR